MIFTKQFITEALDKKVEKNFYQMHPYETVYNQGEKTPMELVFLNYFTFFDLRSKEIKQLGHQSRINIIEKCFSEQDLDVIPNEEKIESCIKREKNNLLDKHFNKRNQYFGNSKKYI